MWVVDREGGEGEGRPDTALLGAVMMLCLLAGTVFVFLCAASAVEHLGREGGRGPGGGAASPRLVSWLIGWLVSCLVGWVVGRFTCEVAVAKMAGVTVATVQAVRGRCCCGRLPAAPAGVAGVGGSDLVGTADHGNWCEVVITLCWCGLLAPRGCRSILPKP